MGLDMYLNGKRFLSEHFNKGDDERARKLEELFPEIADLPTAFGQPAIKEVTAEIGYWRKANAIHQWFVDNVQEGADDCGYHYVDRRSLEELQDLCEQVLEDRDKAGELLPPQAGFFFGSQAIDEGYFDDIKHTIQVIDRALSLPESWEFVYRSSW